MMTFKFNYPIIYGIFYPFQTNVMLLSHLGEYPCEYENLKFVAESPKMIWLIGRNTEKSKALWIPYECEQTVANTCKSITNKANRLRFFFFFTSLPCPIYISSSAMTEASGNTGRVGFSICCCYTQCCCCSAPRRTRKKAAAATPT